MSGGMMGGGAGLILAIIAALIFGVNPGDVINQAPAVQEPAGPLTPADEEARAFVETILADTEAAWSAEFAEQGMDYPEPTLVLFSGAVQSACGMAGAAVGPFYCPMDRQVYLDLSFFSELAERFGAPGDFAQAYVIAHEVGHHVQTVLGISDRIRQEQEGSSQERANALQVRMELQADCFAGMWGAHAQSQSGFLEVGDIEEGMAAASAIGDDRLQRQAQGYVVPESFTHGTSEQRVAWFRRGLGANGDLNACDTSGEI
jgi:predicted metalloprotease